MSSDKRLFQKDAKTRRFNVVNLPRSGAFGAKKTIDRAYIGGPEICQCAKGPDFCPPWNCARITDVILPDACDFTVCECNGADFAYAINVLELPSPPEQYNCDVNWKSYINLTPQEIQELIEKFPANPEN